MQIGDLFYPVCDAGFSGSEFGVQGIKNYHTERGCDELETWWAKATLTFTIFHQRCVVTLDFLMEVRLLVLIFLGSPSLCSHFRIMLAATPSPCLTNVSLLLKHVSVSNGVQGHCFDTMSLLRLALLRLGNVALINVCLNARPKMAPGAAWSLCPLCICLFFCLDIDCC